jgi:hypothetical protein
MTGKQQVLNADFVSKIFPVNLPAMLDAYTAVDVNFNFTGFFLVDYKGRFLNEMVARKYASSTGKTNLRAALASELIRRFFLKKFIHRLGYFYSESAVHQQPILCYSTSS